MRWPNLPWLPGTRFGSEDRYVAAGAVDEIAVGEIRRVRGLPAILCRTASRVYAVGLTCPHAGAQLSQGRLMGDCLECPRHSARFALDQDLAAGQDTVISGETALLLDAHDVKVTDGIIYVSRRPHHQVGGRWDDDVPADGRRAAEGSAPG